MTFRRDSDRSRDWRQWLHEHREALTAAGLPIWVFEYELRWTRFLEEDGFDLESGWSVGMLSEDGANRLREFVVNEYGLVQYRGCICSLDRK